MCVAGLGFRNADNAVLALQLEHRAQGVGGVQPIGTAQGRVCDGNGMDVHIMDLDRMTSEGDVNGLTGLAQAGSSHTSGKSRASSMTKSSPDRPMMAIMIEQVFSVSLSFMPLILQMTQNPLSFIHATSLDPQPMTRAR